MKRPLEKHLIPVNACNGLLSSKILSTVLLLFLVFNISTAQSISRTECDCLNNGSGDIPTNYGEQVTITAPAGQTWRLQSVNGLYQASSPTPPGAPIYFPPNYIIPETSPGVYVLDAIRLNATDWQIMVGNGTISLPVTSAHQCVQPDETIIGDFGTCVGNLETYEVDFTTSEISNMTWTVSGGGNIVGGQGTPKIYVNWGNVVGKYVVSFTGNASSYDGQSNNFCSFSGQDTVFVMDEEAFSMACNNLVNISLNGKCELNVVADMILEDMQFSNDSYDLEFIDTETGLPVVGPILDMSYVNKTLQVKVIHECSGNSCWGYIKLEDKSIPFLDCGDDVTIDCDEFMLPESTGFPVDDDVIITSLGNQKYKLVGFDKCSEATLFYEDVPLSINLCDGPFSSIIERRWKVTDLSGNMSTCDEKIYVNKATLDDITFPESYDDVLGPNPSLEACGNYPKLPNGNPHPSFTGMPQGTFCLNVKVDYEDTVLPKCGTKSFKVRRRWTVQDLCTGASLPPYTQNITVVDRTPPVCSPPSPFTVGATALTCSSIIEVPAPNVVNECSGWSYEVSYKIPDGNPDPFFQPSNEGVVLQPGGTYLISGIESETSFIYVLYYITDDCGNTSRCFTTVTIEDDIQPIPVCDLHTFVGLNEDGVGYASIESFDDGSWDNCSIDYMEVRRMENFACGSTVQWGEKVKFCCADVGKIIMVQLRVWDKSGNSNTCMVEAEVQDNYAPVITNCPANITIDCDDDTVNLDQYGTATAEDNCNVTVTSTSQRNLNACGTGMITRTFTAKDNAGNQVTCTQKITVRSLNPFYINPNNPNDPNDDIVWPGNHTVTNGCSDSGVSPDDLPAGKQRPEILREGCSQVSYTYDDQVFQYTDEACFKILREWTVIDDCVFVPFSNVGKWTYTQVLKVENATAPTITSGCQSSDYTITQEANCTARIQGVANATDDCDDLEDLEFVYKIDENNNGSIDFTGTGRTINRFVTFGNHRIIWEVEDVCGNVKSCSTIVNVADNKAPTPYCLSEIVTVVMENSGSVTIWASDFDAGSYDNCTSQGQLRYSFSTNVNNTSMTFTCDDLDSTSTAFELTMYVTDLSGNKDFCTTTLLVQDNQNYCGDNIDNEGGEEESRVSLAGNITNGDSESMEGVEVYLYSNLPEFPIQAMTDEAGEYAFDNLLASNDYSLVPTFNASYNEGVSTLDLVLIQQHILGIKTLDNPYKVIAADINNNEKITATDLLQLRKLILGIYAELPDNDSWTFVDAALEFPDANNPFPYINQINMADMDNDYMDANFVAVKIGDVNNSANPNLKSENSSEVRSSMSLKFEDRFLTVGEHIINIYSDEDAMLFGGQFALGINPDLVADVKVQSDAFEIEESNYIFESNKIRVSMHSATEVYISRNVAQLIITVTKPGYLADMVDISTPIYNNEIYVKMNGHVEAINFDFEIENRNMDKGETFELLQNVPNPFTMTTEIGFVLPSAQKVSLRIMDVTGKVVFQRQGTYPMGYNTMSLNVADIDASGVLYYQLDTEKNSASKKMIIIR